MSYPDDDENFVRSANRLSEWDDGVDVGELLALVPVKNGAESILDQDNADNVCRALKAVLNGAALSDEQVLETFRAKS